MNKVIVGIGIPGAGKTTLLKSFAEKHGYLYVSPDDIRKELTGNESNQTRNADVWKEVYARSAQGLRDGTLVLDSTMVNREQRQEMLAFLRANGAEHIQGVFCDAPFPVALQRNSDRERVIPGHAMARMKRLITEAPPEIGDGFDSLFTFDEYGALVKAEMMSDGKEVTKEFKKFQ
ncbi:MAG: ATP-binding protein [Candidatus Pacebacteria bacterium]|nr:ATP-binding protein [Candidatus Paceibacterota bacterium]